MKINLKQVLGRVPVSIVAPEGNLDGSNYKELIAAGQKLCDAGASAMVLDLSAVEFLSSAGVLAIYSLARMLSGHKPPDPDEGWRALHAMAEDQEKLPGLKLAGAHGKVDKTLKMVGLDGYLEMYPDVDAAVAAF